MKTSHRRIALLTGASISALGIATPALADPRYPDPAPHDTVSNGAHPGDNSTFVGPGAMTNTITICDIADNPECFLGVKNAGAGSRSATVNSVATGQIEQWVFAATGPVTIAVTNATGDSAEIGAVAIANGGYAFADLNTAISQYASGNDDITIVLDNNGSLLIDALAVSTAGDANKDGTISADERAKAAAARNR